MIHFIAIVSFLLFGKVFKSFFSELFAIFLCQVKVLEVISILYLQMALAKFGDWNDQTNYILHLKPSFYTNLWGSRPKVLSYLCDCESNE